MSVLLYTNIFLDVLRGQATALTFVRGLRLRPSVSVATVAQLFAGARSRREESGIEALLTGAHLPPVTPEIARAAGSAMRQYQRSHGLDDFDAIIAATADHHGLELATLNVKHFPMFAKLRPAY